MDVQRLAQGGLYPRMDRIRTASKRVALAVIQQAVKEGVCGEKLPDDLEAHLEQRMWQPVFLPIRKARGG